MPDIGATDKEKRELAMRGYSEPVLLPGAEGPPKITYHNPKTGQEFPDLPADSYNLMHYIGRGLTVGPPSAELKAKWDAREVVEVASTITGTELPPELQQANLNNQGLVEEVAALTEMVKMLVIAQGADKTAEASVPKSKDKSKKSKSKKKNAIIEEEITEEQVPFDTQLGLLL